MFLNKRDFSVQSNLALNIYHRFLESARGEASRATADKYPTLEIPVEYIMPIVKNLGMTSNLSSGSATHLAWLECDSLNEP